ncbi:helix-turn-helix domain-containing protein [Roseicyclus sp.]|uniref:helix-turn-helix domain-containing protein n=1 Tax=Roseicyclus sp. TaxID=1914329 RepID=UPI003F6B2668
MIAPVFSPAAEPYLSPTVEEVAGRAMAAWARARDRQRPALPNNNPHRRGNAEPVDIERFRELVAQGLTARQIGAQLGCSKDWVFRLAAKYELSIGRANLKQDVPNA